MFAGETRLDDQDAFFHSQVGCWVKLEWRGDLFSPPMGQAFGTHLATFIFCQYGQEIRGINGCWLYADKNGRLFRVGKIFTGINATWIFKYSTLKKFTAVVLSKKDADFLQLPDFDKALHNDIPQAIRELRMDPILLPFRHPGFGDDVSVICGTDIEHPTSFTMSGSQVWVRLSSRISDSCFTGTLLNQPIRYAFLKGEKVSVKLIKSEAGIMLVCAKCNS